MVLMSRSKKLNSTHSRKKNHNHPHKRGVPGADDLIAWLFLQMNEKGVTIKEMSEKTGVGTRTLNSWKSKDESKRKQPSLRSIVVCMECIGFYLLPQESVIPMTEDEHFFPPQDFMDKLCRMKIRQKAKSEKLTEEEWLDKDNAEYLEECREGVRTLRERF